MEDTGEVCLVPASLGFDNSRDMCESNLVQSIGPIYDM